MPNVKWDFVSECVLKFLKWIPESFLFFIKMQGEFKLNLFEKYASLN